MTAHYFCYAGGCQHKVHGDGPRQAAHQRRRRGEPGSEQVNRNNLFKDTYNLAGNF